VDFSQPAAQVERLHRTVGHLFPLVAQLPDDAPAVQLLHVRLAPPTRVLAAAPGSFLVSKETDGHWLNIWWVLFGVVSWVYHNHSPLLDAAAATGSGSRAAGSASTKPCVSYYAH
jgi:hypothetical protein